MNRTLLNDILKKVLYSCDSISSNVNIILADQEMPIDVRLFQNPIKDYGDIRLQSVDSSERIANLINTFGSVSDMEECYKIILNGIKETPFLALSYAKENTENPNITCDKIKALQYVNLSRQIQKIKTQENRE